MSFHSLNVSMYAYVVKFPSTISEDVSSDRPLKLCLCPPHTGYRTGLGTVEAPRILGNFGA